jgi:hypothetical protein
MEQFSDTSIGREIGLSSTHTHSRCSQCCKAQVLRGQLAGFRDSTGRPRPSFLQFSATCPWAQGRLRQVFAWKKSGRSSWSWRPMVLPALRGGAGQPQFARGRRGYPAKRMPYFLPALQPNDPRVIRPDLLLRLLRQVRAIQQVP